MQRPIAVNTWVWESPLTDANLPPLLARIADMGFDAVELPLENVGDLSAGVVRDALGGLSPLLVGAMAPGRELVLADDAVIARTQHYLSACIRLAHDIGAPAVCGPFYAHTGRVWRMDAAERADAYTQLRRRLAPLAAEAEAAGVVLGIEPLNRYETSLLNTTAQALEALGPLLGHGVGLALDTYHLNIEERSSADAVRAAGRHLVHVQVCGNDRGAPGGDQTDWTGIFDALDAVGYTGALSIESFTARNASIATAASIWRPLAESQDQLAEDGLAFLRSCAARSPGGHP
ncbi:sugar phosphate isomerase [Kocuria rosea]|uniref:sugar phosphate isomerase/epimerase family protein n=1 Tax=Kocuria rosea TaxID=1275 RepID=UPI000D655523|nr:sugar phosphate isomerase/epimerase family protein [Kocuria rosea]MEB2526133.1 sugar phosphate isomerase/epimerase family protein [Kocuria rosea]MEB2619319.1 sugar phosphate isomerase/epimerase family protein [Kocuria rosea]PWF84955.1 sugar phosphate isomerase [Kocuria rosea]QCY33270.1 sugar phosphate isomerase/epimerase [Kocuria rosea]TQN36204.1 D-psicose/D-tagatose/L-ribulose 3-epimerase [Kocuria rosea]